MTSNEKKFPTNEEYMKLFYTDLTIMNIDYTYLHLKKKLKESGKKWRKILKALYVLEFVYTKSMNFFVRTNQSKS